MLGSNVLDAIPCDLKAENTSNCNKTRLILHLGSIRGILKILGVKSETLQRRILFPSSSILASVKSTNVNKKLAQIIYFVM